ncbi:hypothetical protein ACLOJK_015004, partial [Asimina triloba]
MASTSRTQPQQWAIPDLDCEHRDPTRRLLLLWPASSTTTSIRWQIFLRPTFNIYHPSAHEPTRPRASLHITPTTSNVTWASNGHTFQITDGRLITASILSIVHVSNIESNPHSRTT